MIFYLTLTPYEKQTTVDYTIIHIVSGRFAFIYYDVFM